MKPVELPLEEQMVRRDYASGAILSCRHAGSRGSAPTWAPLCAVLLLATPLSALGQGQDSETAATGAQAPGHPAPLGSSASATAVPGGQEVKAQPLASEFYRKDENGLILPSPLRFANGFKLACQDIRDETARTRCQDRREPSSLPKGFAE
jgi:hypothetical protein